jgi:hypothetical protein
VATLWPTNHPTGGDPLPGGEAYEFHSPKVEFGMPAKVRCARGYELDVDRSDRNCFEKMTDPIQNSPDVPFSMQHMKDCKCGAGRF